MKIVNWEEFIKLPVGTVFWEYEPHAFWNPGVVREWLDVDGVISDFFMTCLLPYWNWEDEVPELNTAWTRWACFDKDQLFCVLDDEDVSVLVGDLIKEKS